MRSAFSAVIARPFMFSVAKKLIKKKNKKGQKVGGASRDAPETDLHGNYCRRRRGVGD